MTDDTRREFLKRIAKTAVYAAPVIHTLAAPVELIGQGSSTQKKPMMAAAFDTQQPSTTTQTNQEAPWDRPPPGDRLETQRPPP
jgi:hypothetical protein